MKQAQKKNSTNQGITEPNIHASASIHERIDENEYKNLFEKLKTLSFSFPIYPGADEGSKNAFSKGSNQKSRKLGSILAVLGRRFKSQPAKSIQDTLAKVFESENASPRDLLFISTELKKDPQNAELRGMHAIISYLSSKHSAPEDLKRLLQNTVFSMVDVFHQGGISLEFVHYFYQMYAQLLKYLVLHSSDTLSAAKESSPKSSFAAEINRYADEINRKRHVAVALHKQVSELATHIHKARQILNKRKKPNLRFKIITDDLIRKMGTAIVANNQPLDEISEDGMHAQDLRTIIIALLRAFAATPILHDLFDRYEPLFLPTTTDKKYIAFKKGLRHQKGRLKNNILDYYDHKTHVYIHKTKSENSEGE